MMFVVKRDGRKEPVHFDKITARITKLSYGLNPDFCDPVSVDVSRHTHFFRSELSSGWSGKYWHNLSATLPWRLLVTICFLCRLWSPRKWQWVYTKGSQLVS